MNMYIGNKLQSPNVEKLRKIALCTILSVFLCIIMSACRSHDLTKDQIQKFKVELCAEDSNEYIIVSGILEVNRWRNRKSLLCTLIRDRSSREKSWFLQGNACQGNSSKPQSLTAGVCRTFTGMQS